MWLKFIKEYLIGVLESRGVRVEDKISLNVILLTATTRSDCTASQASQKPRHQMRFFYFTSEILKQIPCFYYFNLRRQVTPPRSISVFGPEQLPL
jgi:hypothetical protein